MYVENNMKYMKYFCRRLKVAYYKESQRRYNQKRVQYNINRKSENDRKDGERVKAYLEQTGQSANTYIKGLIRRDIDDKGFVVVDDVADASINKMPMDDAHNNDAVIFCYTTKS